MVTTTVRMLDGVHGNTSDARPVPLLGVSLEVGFVGLEKGLVSSLATGNDADHSSAASNDGFTDARGESHTGLLAVLGMANDDGGGSGSAGEDATVTQLSLEVGNDGSLGHGINREDVADSEGGFGAAVDELAGVHALNSDEKLSVLLEFVLVSEDDLGEGGASAWVMNDVLNNALDVSLALGEVEGSECRGRDSLVSFRLEDCAATSSLGSNNSSHD